MKFKAWTRTEIAARPTNDDAFLADSSNGVFTSKVMAPHSRSSSSKATPARTSYFGREFSTNCYELFKA